MGSCTYPKLTKNGPLKARLMTAIVKLQEKISQLTSKRQHNSYLFLNSHLLSFIIVSLRRFKSGKYMSVQLALFCFVLKKVGTELSEVPYHDQYFIVIQILFGKLPFFTNIFFYFQQFRQLNWRSQSSQ